MARKITTKKASKKTAKVENVMKTRNSKLTRKNAVIGVVIIALFAFLFIFKSFFVAAIVNNQPISRIAVIQELEKQNGKKTLDGIITRTLIYQEANKQKITVNQKEIDAQMKTIDQNVSKQGITLDQALKAQGMTKKDLIEDVRLQLIVQKIVGNIDVSQKEIDDYISANKEQIPQTTNQDEVKQQAIQQIKQQKLQQKVQDFIQQLRQKAKITSFIQY